MCPRAKLVSAIMKNEKNGSNSSKMHPRAKLPITDPPKLWVSGFLSVDGNGKLVSAIMKNQKNGSNSPKMHPRAKQCQTAMYEPACVILTLLDIFSEMLQSFVLHECSIWPCKECICICVRSAYVCTKSCTKIIS